MLEKRLAVLSRGARGEGSTKDDEKAETAREETAEAVRGSEEKTAIDSGAAEEIAGLLRKLGLAEESEAERARDFIVRGGDDAMRQEKTQTRDAEKGEYGAAAWMREDLGAGGTNGAFAAAERERTVFSLPQEREVHETEAFSLSLERDARRYDGGFLYY